MASASILPTAHAPSARTSREERAPAPRSERTGSTASTLVPEAHTSDTNGPQRLATVQAFDALNVAWHPVQVLAPAVYNPFHMNHASHPHRPFVPSHFDRARYMAAALGAEAAASLFVLQVAGDCFVPSGPSLFNPAGRTLPVAGALCAFAALPSLVFTASMLTNVVACAIQTACRADRVVISKHQIGADVGGYVLGGAASAAALAGCIMGAVGAITQARAGFINDPTRNDLLVLCMMGATVGITTIPALSWYAGQGLGAATAAVSQALARGVGLLPSGVRLPDEA